MNRRRTNLLLSLLLLPAVALAGVPLHSSGESAPSSVFTRDAFYCQNPDFAMIYNMSSGFDAEIADDIPAEWAGETVTSVTLWIGQWYSMGGPQWTDPVGVRLNLYGESCPPSMDPFRTIEVAWADLDKTHVYGSGGSDVYEVHILLNPPLVLEAGMSLGTTALIDWGHDEPFTGIVATPTYVSYGACPAYLDASWWGYDRWTSIDFFTQIPQDVAYCLTGPTTTVPSAVDGGLRLTAQPNPFNPRTTFRFDLAEPGTVVLRIYDVSGRAVATLVDGWREAGVLTADWDGRNAAGRPMATGVYTAIIRTAGGTAQTKVLLAE